MDEAIVKIQKIPAASAVYVLFNFCKKFSLEVEHIQKSKTDNAKFNGRFKKLPSKHIHFVCNIAKKKTLCVNFELYL